jgi:hypothetical protein
MDWTNRRATSRPEISFLQGGPLRVLLLALPVLLSSCGGSPKSSGPMSEAKVEQAPSATATPVVREISEDELVRYIDTLKELRQLGVTTETKLGDDPMRLESMFAGMEATGKFGEILGRHGFTHDAFMQVHYNVVQTYAAISIDERRGEIEESKNKQAAALGSMKGKVPPEQFEAMRQATEQGNQMLEGYRDVPAINKELLIRHRDQFHAAVGK